MEAEQKAMLALEETNQFLSTIDLAANISIDQSINQSFAVSQGPHNRTSHDILGFDGKTAKKFNTRKPHGELLKSAKSLKNLNDNNYLKAVLSPKAKDGHLLGNGNSPDLRFSGRPGKM